MRNPRLDALVPTPALAVRGAAGAGQVGAAGNSRACRDVAAIGLIADQVPRTSPEKHWTEFLGQDTAFYMGPELLGRALRAQVVLVRDAATRRAAATSSTFEPLNEPGERLPHGEVTGRYARALEAWIRDDPAGWWWSHQRWKLQRKVY